MRKCFDYFCDKCDHLFEVFVEADEVVGCPECKHTPATKRLSGGHIFTVIKATTRTSGKYKAGYTHNYWPKAAEKISVQVPAGPSSTLVKP